MEVILPLNWENEECAERKHELFLFPGFWGERRGPDLLLYGKLVRDEKENSDKYPKQSEVRNEPQR